MERYNDRIAITGQEIIGNICTKDQYHKLAQRGKLRVLRRGCRNTPALIDYETMPERLKVKVIQLYGDPVKVLSVNKLIKYIEHDTQARDFFNHYLTCTDEHLPAHRITEYITNAELLQAIGRMVANKRAFRKALDGNTRGIWESISSTLSQLDKTLYPHSLPENPARLRERYANYRKDGYMSLIHRGYGNKNTEKLSEQAKLWCLARWSNMVDRVTSINHLFALYNNEAPNQGWKTIESPQTLYNYLYSEGVKDMWWSFRYGELKAKEKFSLQHSTRMPSMRDSLWYSDGTKLNYYYLTEDGKIETCQVYEVMDAYSEVLLGYHISRTEDFEAQFKAFKMAVQTAGHRPYQIGFDNQGGHKKLENAGFLTKLAHLSIATQPFNGKSKTIESAFGRVQETFLKREWYFTGMNITAKKAESRANMEFILANKANLPSLEEVKAVYEQRRNDWNNAPHPKTGIPRMEMYRNSHNPATPVVELTDMVDLFWLERPQPVMLTAFGISFTEKKVKYDYLVYKDGMPDQMWLRKNIDKKFHIKYDPDDMSLIYLYEKDATGMRFVTVAETKVTVARGKQEQEQWETEFITKVNRERDELRVERVDKVEEILRAHSMHPENYGLKAPGIKGSKRRSKDKQSRTESYGEYQKALSNVVADDIELKIADVI